MVLKWFSLVINFLILPTFYQFVYVLLAHFFLLLLYFLRFELFYFKNLLASLWIKLFIRFLYCGFILCFYYIFFILGEVFSFFTFIFNLSETARILFYKLSLFILFNFFRCTTDFIKELVDIYFFFFYTYFGPFICRFSQHFIMYIFSYNWILFCLNFNNLFTIHLF